MRRASYVLSHYETAPEAFGRSGRYPRNLAKAVAATGRYEVELVACVQGAGSRVTDLGAGVRLRMLDSARAAGEALSWELTAVLRDADLVHVHDVFSRTGEVALLAAKLVETPVCVTDHGRTTSRLGQSLGILNLADRVVCYSSLGRSLISSSSPVTLVPGGVDDEFFAPGPAPPERDRFLFVGRLAPEKGIDRLLAALPPSAPLCICGRAEHPEYAQRLRELAAGKPVEFIAGADDVQLRELYRRAIALVLPAVYVDCYGSPHPAAEMMAFTVLEAMACGTPVICSRTGAMPEYVEAEATGFLFDDASELTLLLERLASDRQLVEAIGQDARRRVTERFGLASAGAAMSSAYDDLLAAAAE